MPFMTTSQKSCITFLSYMKILEAKHLVNATLQGKVIRFYFLKNKSKNFWTYFKTSHKAREKRQRPEWAC